MTLCTIIACSIALSGCATLNQAQCNDADWLQIGQQDGAAGRPLSYADKHHSACSKHGINVDFSRYNEGRMLGLGSYCSAESGYQTGLKGLEYAGVCPDGQAKDFTSAYVKGLQLKQQQLAIEYDHLRLQRSHQHLRHLAAIGHKAERGERRRRHHHLRSRLRQNLSERLEIQQWIAQWSAPQQ